MNNEIDLMDDIEFFTNLENIDFIGLPLNIGDILNSAENTNVIKENTVKQNKTYNNFLKPSDCFGEFFGEK